MHPEEREEQGRGRSAKKRAAKAVEEIAEQLVGLAEAQMKHLPLPTELLEELQLARSTRGHGSRQRQIKHLAAELRRRSEELPAIQDFLDGLHASQQAEKKSFHRLEVLRDRLCRPDEAEAALTEVGRTVSPEALREISRLSRLCQRGGDRKPYRDLFRLLRQHLPDEV